MPEAIIGCALVLLPFLLVAPPIWMWWPPNWSRYTVSSELLETAYEKTQRGLRIELTPQGQKDLRPFAPQCIEIWSTLFFWELRIWTDLGRDSIINALYHSQFRVPIISMFTPSPSMVMSWICAEALECSQRQADKGQESFTLTWLQMSFGLGRNERDLKKIKQYAPGCSDIRPYYRSVP